MKSKRKRVKNAEVADGIDGAKISAGENNRDKIREGTEEKRKALDNRRLSGHDSSSDDDEQPAAKKIDNAQAADGKTGAAQSSSKRRCPTVDEAELTLEKVRLEEEEDAESTPVPSSKNTSASKSLSTKRGSSERQILRSSSSASSDAPSSHKGDSAEAAKDVLVSSRNDHMVGAGKARSSSFSDPRSAKRGRRSVDPVDESLDLNKVKLSDTSTTEAAGKGTKKKKRSTEDEVGDSKASMEDQSKKKRPANVEERDVDPKKRPATTTGATCNVDDDTALSTDKVRLVDADPATKKKKSSATVEKDDDDADDDDTSLDLGKVRLDDENLPTTTGRGRGFDDKGDDAPSRKKKRKESHGGHHDEEEAYKEAISTADEKTEENDGVLDGSGRAEKDSKVGDNHPEPNEEIGDEAEGKLEDKSGPSQDEEEGPDGEDPSRSKKRRTKHESKLQDDDNDNDNGNEDEIDLESKAYRAAITSADEANGCEEQADGETNVDPPDFDGMGGKKNKVDPGEEK